MYKFQFLYFLSRDQPSMYVEQVKAKFFMLDYWVS